MMGHSHALSGIVGWMAVVPFLDGREVLGVSFDLGPGEIVAGSLVCAGAALIPDLDAKSSTITNTYGAFTRALSGIFNWMFGGHRNGTHSLLFAVLMGSVTQGLALWSEFAVQIFVFLLLGIAFNGLGLGSEKNSIASAVINAMATGAVTLALFTSGVDYSWIGLAVAFGCFLHFLGDMATELGVPLLWPATKYRFGEKIGFTTDSKVERNLVTPSLTIAIVLLTFYLFPWPELLPEV
ncbi:MULTISPECIES: metal-dependent hydrolase [Streptomonospora]|uniref:Metal-dependent hydrolase n=2 Tax=Streptomonospora TaxID=104204 RepID=A0ABV9SG29_9ACTN